MNEMKDDIFEGVRVVWFDLDDTLIDFRLNSRIALSKIYYSQQLDRWFASSENWIRCYEYYNHKLWSEYAMGVVSRDELILERFCLPFIEAGCSRSEAEMLSRRLHMVYLDALANEKNTVEGAKSLLALVRAKGFRIGILSNGFAEVQYRKMESAGIADMIDFVVLSDDIGFNKPDERIFRYAESISGIMHSHGHIMIGDNLSTDIDGAINAGWRSIWYVTGEVSGGDQRADRQVRSLGEIMMMLS